jgi:hypothetical protein
MKSFCRLYRDLQGVEILNDEDERTVEIGVIGKEKLANQHIAVDGSASL